MTSLRKVGIMDKDGFLKDALRNIFNLAYPEEWTTAWLPLPLGTETGKSPYSFQVICYDLPTNRADKSDWPPSSRDPKIWIRWEPNPGTGFGSDHENMPQFYATVLSSWKLTKLLKPRGSRLSGGKPCWTPAFLLR